MDNKATGNAASFSDYLKGAGILAELVERKIPPESYSDWFEACLALPCWYQARQALRREWANMLDGKKPPAERTMADTIMTAADFELGPSDGEKAEHALYRDATAERITAPTMHYCAKWNVITIGSYDVDLDGVTSAFGVADWIFHLSKKPWFSSAMAGDFVYLLKSTGILRQAMNAEWAKTA